MNNNSKPVVKREFLKRKSKEAGPKTSLKN